MEGCKEGGREVEKRGRGEKEGREGGSLVSYILLDLSPPTTRALAFTSLKLKFTLGPQHLPPYMDGPT